MIQMAEPSALNSESDNKVDQYVGAKSEDSGIKKEVEVLVKPEVVECAVCVSRSHECFDIFSTSTAASGASLHHLLCRLTHVDLSDALDCSKVVCKSCFDLLNLLERAELEYDKLKETFRAVISKNPLFETPELLRPIALPTIKAEVQNGDDAAQKVDEDSEDEPLARTKKKRYRKLDKRKKKPAAPKRKLRVRSSEVNENDSWECGECGACGAGGAVAAAAHTLAAHTLSAHTTTVLRDVKTEDSADASQSPPYSNAFDSCLKIEFENYDESTSDLSDIISLSNNDTKNSKKSKGKLVKTLKVKTPVLKKKKTTKVIHQCDQCDAKYTSWTRLERHKQKHEGSKPPYICEVCGAHYKHKRACDIHIALHKGISDWKCEECNKLFPSKSALQRHNNIHTGKLNYQCDQCGKSFIHTSSFKMHKLSHSGVKPHACDVCGLALMTRSHLKRHKRVHSGEKRHECAVCGKRFSERYNLAAHTKSHEASEEVAHSAAGSVPRRRLFRCAFCPERFERRYMLERHASVVHGRTLERPPPTPRNTMSKLLKAQAQRRVSADTADPARSQDPTDPARSQDPAHPAEPAPADKETGTNAPPTLTPQKLIAQLSSSSSSMITMGSWSGAYAAEFGLRHDYSH